MLFNLQLIILHPFLLQGVAPDIQYIFQCKKYNKKKIEKKMVSIVLQFGERRRKQKKNHRSRLFIWRNTLV